MRLLLPNCPVSTIKTFKMLGITVSQDLKWKINIKILKKALAVNVLPATAEETRSATGAVETVLCSSHRICPTFIHHSLVWCDHKEQARESLVQPTDSQGLAHCKNSDKGRQNSLRHNDHHLFQPLHLGRHDQSMHTKTSRQSNRGFSYCH